jgi:hypothetical protein
MGLRKNHKKMLVFNLLLAKNVESVKDRNSQNRNILPVHFILRCVILSKLQTIHRFNKQT